MNDIPAEVLVTGRRAALLVIDVQNDFCAEGGVFAESGRDLTDVHDALARIHGFLAAAREVIPRIIFVRSIYDDLYISASMRRRRRTKGVPDGHCRSGTWGADFFEVVPAPSDVVIVKHRFSAFVDTDLPLLLRSADISTLYHVGFFTNVCVESTVRDAAMRDFDAVVVADCTAALDRDVHTASLASMDRTFGYVADSEVIQAAWRGEKPLPGGGDGG